MPASTLAGVISAVAAVFTALALVITAVAGLMAARRAGRKIDAVHKIVNQQHTDLVNYQRALIRALEGAGISVPVDQSAEASSPESTDR
jgi:NAD(P)H-hydrate repair Nnr-like enzyme with NAD(P)H-hydrate dehydratase domain